MYYNYFFIIWVVQAVNFVTSDPERAKTKRWASVLVQNDW